MRSKVAPVVVYTIIILALFGFGYNVIENPTGLLKNLITILAFGALFAAAFYFLFIKKRVGSTSPDMKKYKQAVKQSQQKYKKNPPIKIQKQKQVTKIKSKPQKKRATHLRVIEGQKSEKKDRALF